MRVVTATSQASALSIVSWSATCQRSQTSCTISSASATDPSIRYAIFCKRGRSWLKTLRISSISGRAVTALLQRPCIAVRVFEVGKARIVATLRVEPGAKATFPRIDRRLVPELADRYAAPDQRSALGREVGRDQVQVTHACGGIGRHQLHRTR